jgi:GTPase SAR1 family protein
MGIVMSLWRSLFSSYDEVKVVMIGLDNAGKTTTLYKLCVILRPYEVMKTNILIPSLFNAGSLTRLW